MEDYFGSSSLEGVHALALPLTAKLRILGLPVYDDHPALTKPLPCIVYVVVGGTEYVDVSASVRDSNRMFTGERILELAREARGREVQPLGELEQKLVDERRAAAKAGLAAAKR